MSIRISTKIPGTNQIVGKHRGHLQNSSEAMANYYRRWYGRATLLSGISKLRAAIVRVRGGRHTNIQNRVQEMNHRWKRIEASVVVTFQVCVDFGLEILFSASVYTGLFGGLCNRTRNGTEETSTVYTFFQRRITT